MGTATNAIPVVFCHNWNISYPYGDSNMSVITWYWMIWTKHFIPLWGQQPCNCLPGCSRKRNISYLYGDSNTRMRVQSYRSAGNISYPYGDSNRRRFFSSTLRHETFYPPMGTATAIVCTSVHLCTETFRTPMGTATFSVIHRRTLRRNISYPYGDSNLENGLVVSLVIETFHTPMVTATSTVVPSSTHSWETFHTPMGTATKLVPFTLNTHSP